MYTANKQRIARLREAVEKQFGLPPHTPSEFDQLAMSIAALCHRRVATSTLKRIWEYVKTEHTPTFTTLSVLARYAGYNDWHSFCNSLAIDSGFNPRGLIIAADVPVGAHLLVEWEGQKWCELERIEGDDRYRVIGSGNIKLTEGDTLSVATIAVGSKFVATDCQRGSLSMGVYTGARGSGILSIKRMEPQKS